MLAIQTLAPARQAGRWPETVVMRYVPQKSGAVQLRTDQSITVAFQLRGPRLAPSAQGTLLPRESAAEKTNQNRRVVANKRAREKDQSNHASLFAIVGWGHRHFSPKGDSHVAGAGIPGLSGNGRHIKHGFDQQLFAPLQSHAIDLCEQSPTEGSWNRRSNERRLRGTSRTTSATVISRCACSRMKRAAATTSSSSTASDSDDRRGWTKSGERS